MKIGDLRRSLFVDYDCQWNGLVRDITASNESRDEEVWEDAVYVGLLETIKVNASLDHSFPRDKGSRVGDLFEDTK